MRKLTFAAVSALLCAACSPSHYYYNFDISDPGAQNFTKPGVHDVLEDADIRTEVLVDPTSFQSILLVITNKTSEPLLVSWNQLSVIGPDRTERPLKPDVGLGTIEPFVNVHARLIPFELPALGSAAAGYDNQTFELVVPLTVRGQPRDYRIHLLAHAMKI
jgi:hypothetical protein